MRSGLRRTGSVLLGLLVLVTTLLGDARPASAAALTAVSWVLSNTSSSAPNPKTTITFTAPTSLAKNVNVTYPWPGGFVLPVGLSFTDMTLTVNGVAQTLAAVRTAAAWGVAVTVGAAGQIVLTNCNNNTCATPVNSVFVLTVGDGAVGGLGDIVSAGDDAAYSMTVTLASGDSGAIPTTISSTLTCTITNSPVGTLVYDLTGTVADTSKSTTISITSNASRGYQITLMATKQLTHTGYGAVTLANSWGGTTTVASAWAAGQAGFGYSTNGGTSYFAFDTATARVVSSGNTVVGTVNVTIDYKAAARDGVEIAGVYAANLVYDCSPVQ